ncbi:A-kinase anchor protein SPHKAP isoform X2 [Protopterus annectens]|uniref:A-kinase anchor protein SPHKAP isoform X2 n=1 Tax=Protopterus annectens TaxID=7888 RepID=UPI001CFB6777|nr:A-kinase anchor protein SPHKAP isoform X2 [Protopterus annectens]
MLCRIGFVEDEAESNCATICFVNLDGGKEDDTNKLKQKLIDISPDLPTLINSLNVQQPKANEIFLLSGLASPGESQKESSSSQCSRLSDVCLVQCARGQRSDASCIIFEINKFLIGLEFVQERQLRLEGNSNVRPEDETNCSVSSIEEDFLTASEQLEDENQSDDFLTGSEKVINPAGEDKLLPGMFTSDKFVPCLEETQMVPREDLTLKGMEMDLEQPHCESSKYLTEYCIAKHSEATKLSVKDSVCDKSIENCSAKVVKDPFIPQYDTIFPHVNKSISDADGKIALQCQHPGTGQYVIPWIQPVFQDKCSKISHSEPQFATKSNGSDSPGNCTVLPVTKEDISMPSRLWHELPKIVIVQTPDSGSHLPECQVITPLSSPSSDVSNPMRTCNNPCDGSAGLSNSSICGQQSSDEAALACTANAFGTISNHHAVECLNIYASATQLKDLDKDHHSGTVTEINSEYMETDYSIPVALRGMSQVAGAVAAGGCVTHDTTYHTASTGLLVAAEASAAIGLHCSVATGSSLEQFSDSIAEILLKEASRILLKPDDYKTVGDFIQAMNSKIAETVKKPKSRKLKEWTKDEFVQNLSNVILKHSVEAANKQMELACEHIKDKSNLNAQGLFTKATNDLLFDVLYSTCKRVKDVAGQNNMSTMFSEESENWRVFEKNEKLSKINFQNKLDCSCIGQTTILSNNDNLLVNDEPPEQLLESVNGTTVCPVLFCHNNKNVSTQDGLEKKSSSRRNVSTSSKDPCKQKNQLSRQSNKRAYPSSECDKNIVASEYKHTVQDQKANEKRRSSENKAKHKCSIQMNNEINMTLLNTNLHPSQHLFQMTYPTSNCSVAEFADELATTVVSMATEMAAICLENSNGKQPWFCAWKRGTEYLAPQAISCRTKKRKKDVQPNQSVIRKHRAPRLSEIKRKTEKHPELKERLMNRVVDESINFDDASDAITLFHNEVSAKILNLTEFPATDNSRQGQAHPRNRLHCERWNRGKPSSYESIPEEEADSARLLNTLGPMSSLSQPVSRCSSMSKQSSCESITDEFSRFMVNQMESEGREFDLLLDYYAGKNANTILKSAIQQVTKKNGHLNIRSSSPSKQSSTESITEEFYRYMLRELDRENKENISVKNTKEWNNNLLTPSVRTPFCFRQSSVPDRSSTSRLTVNAPVKAKSFDGFAQSTHNDMLSLQQINSVSSSNLCKSDSCLYQRCKTDQITDMLIHETWSSSIEALMRKNKIITDDSEITDYDPIPGSSQPQVEQFANKLAADIVESGKSFIGTHQDSVEYTNKDCLNEARQCSNLTDVFLKQTSANKTNLTEERDCFKAESVMVHKPNLHHCRREVPLIHIEGDQREDFSEDIEKHISDSESLEKVKESLSKELPAELDFKKSKPSSLIHCRHISKKLVTELAEDSRTTEESVNNLSCSSEESTGSWSQLNNDEENPDDTSSYLQLSERSLSNGNSSTSSSLGTADLEGDHENIAHCMITSQVSALIEKNEFLKEHQENLDEYTSGLSIGTTTGQKDILIINFDLRSECADSELRATLQWIAASELGIPTVYFCKSQEKQIEKFLHVVHLVHRKAWKVGDLFRAIIQYCKEQEQHEGPTISLFDWILEFG